MIVFELLLGFTVGLLLIGVSVVELNAEVKRDVALGCGCYVQQSSIRQAKKALGWRWLLPVAFTPCWNECLFLLHIVSSKHLGKKQQSVSTNNAIRIGIPVPCSLLYPSCCSSSLQMWTSNPPASPSCRRSWQNPCCSSPFPSSSSRILGSSSSLVEWACPEELHLTENTTSTCVHDCSRFFCLLLQLLDLGVTEWHIPYPIKYTVHSFHQGLQFPLFRETQHTTAHRIGIHIVHDFVNVVEAPIIEYPLFLLQ